MVHTNHSRQRTGIHEIIHLYDKNDYNIKRKVITTQNPQANSIIERVHQTIENILSTFCMHDTVLEKDNPWDRILVEIMFAIRATVHTVM